MIVDLSPETRVAAAARAWREASRGADVAAREAAERQLADHLELWMARLLASDERWPLQGRWFDGLVFLECSAEEDERFNMRGYIWRIDTQEKYPFWAAIRLSPEALASFEIRFGDPPSPLLLVRRAETSAETA